MMLLLWLTILGCAINNAAAQSGNVRCEAKSSKESGLCIPIRECPYFFDILNGGQPTPAQRQQLADSQCGVVNERQALVERILICCPDSKRSIQGTPARSAEAQTEAGNVLPSSNGSCGWVFADRIYGGTATKLDEFPWMALLQYKKPNNKFGFHCGGALINSRYVLTAGHCLANNQVSQLGWQLNSVRLGEWNTSTAPDCVTELGSGKRTCAPAHLDIEVEQRIIHELYVADSRDRLHDIALLRLKRTVSYTDYVHPICLPLANDMRNRDYEGYAMDIAGWGVTENGTPSSVKLTTTVDVWELESCQQKYRAYPINLNSSQMCAGGNGKMDTCQGDSGGPLMLRTHEGMQEIYFAVGVTSFGPNPCGQQDWPGVYTRVGYFINWIQQKLQP